MDEQTTSASDQAVWIQPSHGRGKLRPWQKGQSGNPTGLAGRKSMLDLVHAAVEHDAVEIAEAYVKQLRKGSVRHFSEYRDTFHGVPKRTLELQQADDPQLQILKELAAIYGLTVTAASEQEDITKGKLLGPTSTDSDEAGEQAGN